MNTYEVTITAKYPACGEVPGVVEVYAKNGAEAVRRAREDMRREGLHDRSNPMSYKAKKTGA